MRVSTPHLARENMYLTSGHLPYYAESMFPPMDLKMDASTRETALETHRAIANRQIEGKRLTGRLRKQEAKGRSRIVRGTPRRGEHRRSYYLKAMNCPHHHRSSPRSRAVIATCRCAWPNTAPAIATSNRASCSA